MCFCEVFLVSIESPSGFGYGAEEVVDTVLVYLEVEVVWGKVRA